MKGVFSSMFGAKNNAFSKAGIALNSFTYTDAFKNLNVYKLQNEKFTRDIPYKMNSLLP